MSPPGQGQTRAWRRGHGGRAREGERPCGVCGQVREVLAARSSAVPRGVWHDTSHKSAHT
eukprot:323597-Chlamydomonas_euryale.AAC.4